MNDLDRIEGLFVGQLETMTRLEQAMILNSFIERLSAPGPATLWLEGVADEVLAMPQDAARAGRASTEPQSSVRLSPPGDHRLSQEGDA